MKLAEFLAEYIEDDRQPDDDTGVEWLKDTIQAGIEAFAKAEDASVIVLQLPIDGEVYC